ncbi:MAG: hypothetical protein ABS882_13475 [Lysinibacillus sp.]
MYQIRANDRETVSVTIIDNSSQEPIQLETRVYVETLGLMLKADHITVQGKTITKESTRVDEFGNIFFHGFVSDSSLI